MSVQALAVTLERYEMRATKLEVLFGHEHLERLKSLLLLQHCRRRRRRQKMKGNTQQQQQPDVTSPRRHRQVPNG